MRTLISAGFGIATTPTSTAKTTSRLEKALPRGALLHTPPVDAGLDWEYALENLGARVDFAALGRSVARAVPGTRFRAQEDPRSRQYSPILLVPKVPRAWPGQIDYAILALMVFATVAFVFLQFHEHLFDFRTLEEMGEVPDLE
jgi:hypothetical protein